MEGLNAVGAKADAVERVAAAKSAKNFMVSNRNLFQWLRMQRVCKRYGTKRLSFSKQRLDSLTSCLDTTSQ